MSEALSKSSRNWTPEQLRAIRTTGHSLLVSAAAGSGKTAVLTERCAYLICDAPQPCDVDELLVVTFTEAAAAEMRTRVRSALANRAAITDDTRAVEQLAGIERATIGTIHSFCGRLLRQHFHAAGLDPAFEILDGDAAALLKHETMREVLDERFRSESPQAFAALLDGYFNGDDAALGSELLSLYETLSSLVDPEKFLSDSRSRLRGPLEPPFGDSHFGNTLLKDLKREITAFQVRIESALQTIRRLGDFPGYLTALNEAASIAANWRATLDSDGIDALAEEVDFQPGNLPSVKNSVPGKTIAKDAVDAIRADMKDGPLCSALRFTEAQWRDGMQRIAAPAEELLSLVEQFGKAYRDAKNRIRALDFSDLERRALTLLSEDGDLSRPSIVARGCHRRYAHVLVDEYQDINEMQEAILRLVSRECIGGPRNGNLFCVGDVKQSIYRFRSAEPKLFLRRYDGFAERDSGGERIDLNSNFRSRAPLLDAINGIFDLLMTKDAADIDYTAGHRLIAGATFPEGSGFAGAPIEMHLVPAKPQASDSGDDQAGDGAEFERAEREAVFIAYRIAQLMGADGSQRAQVAADDGSSFRDVRYGDIAILLRTRKFKVEQYANVLRKSGIPVLAEGGSGFFTAMEVLDLLSLLQVLDNFRQDLPLAAVLRSPLGSLAEPEDSLARIRLAYRDDGTAFHEAVSRYAVEQDDELAARLRDVLARLSAWRELAQQRPLAETLATIYEQSGYLAFVCGLEDGEQRKANLLELHRRATQFEQMNGGGLSRFLQFLDGLADEVDAGQAALTAEATDAVRIITIHRSKGLEFPIVFVADLGKAFNLTDARGPIVYDKDEGLGLYAVDEERLVRYPTLATTVITPRLKRKMLAEELRVMYVALTRAKEHLILVGTAREGQHEKWVTRWTGHAGVIPADDTLSATTALAWLGPVAVATGLRTIDITSHEALPSIETSKTEAAAAIERLAPLSILKLLEPAPAVTDVAAEVIGRLAFEYPHAAYTRTAGAQSVTSRAHASDPHPPVGQTFLPVSPPVLPPALSERQKTGGEEERQAGMPVLQDANAATEPGIVPTPRFAAASGLLGAADVGTATHLVLEHLDFSPLADTVRNQIAAMVDAKLLAREHAKVVDIASIDWLLASEVGQLLRENAEHLRRELPVYFAATVDGAPVSDDPRDRVMVRGRIDLFVPTLLKDYIVDYKTDRVRGTALDERIAAYRLQMDAYASALSSVTGRRPAVWLVFLSQRKNVEL